MFLKNHFTVNNLGSLAHSPVQLKKKKRKGKRDQVSAGSFAYHNYSNTGHHGSQLASLVSCSLSAHTRVQCRPEEPLSASVMST
jgi:hypothetical protein